MGTKIETGYEDVDEFMDTIPRGEYLAWLTEVEETESSAGKPMLVWDFTLLEEFPGAVVRGWTSLQEHALGEARKYFRAIGKTWKAGDDLEKIARKSIKKAKVRVVVTTRNVRDRETGEDRESNKIIGIYAAGTATKKEAATKKKKGKGKGEDDIPF